MHLLLSLAHVTDSKCPHQRKQTQTIRAVPRDRLCRSAADRFQDQAIDMSNRNYSPHQQKVIKRYYDNRDAIDDQRLSELVTNLYLATGKKQEKMWDTAEQIMNRMGLPESRIQHVMDVRDPAAA